MPGRYRSKPVTQLLNALSSFDVDVDEAVW